MLKAETKKQQTAQLAENFKKSKAAFLVNCIGLNAGQTTELRKSLKQNQGDMQVIRNSLSLRVIEEQKELKSAFADHIEGPCAFVLAFEDPAKTAKIIDSFAQDHKPFKIKAGVIGHQALDTKAISALAELPSEEVLKARFLGLLSAVPSKFLSILQAPQISFIRVLKAKEEQTSKKS